MIYYWRCLIQLKHLFNHFVPGTDDIRSTLNTSACIKTCSKLMMKSVLTHVFILYLQMMKSDRNKTHALSLRECQLKHLIKTKQLGYVASKSETCMLHFYLLVVVLVMPERYQKLNMLYNLSVANVVGSKQKSCLITFFLQLVMSDNIQALLQFLRA